MQRILALILILVFTMVGFAYAESAMKDTYKAVKKAELKASGPGAEADSSLADAQAEFDLFKDSKEGKKNPEFTGHIGNAIKAIQQAQFSDHIAREGGRYQVSFSQAMSKASRELEAAKQYLK